MATISRSSDKNSDVRDYDETTDRDDADISEHLTTAFSLNKPNHHTWLENGKYSVTHPLE